MDGLILGLLVLSMAVICERAMLARHKRRQRAHEQAFRFHALRDELQFFLAEERVRTSSLTYKFLMQAINFAIRNAGEIRLQDIVEVAATVERKVDETRFEAIHQDIGKHDANVQKLARDFFLTFTDMLVSNDWFVRACFAMTGYFVGGWDLLRPFLRRLDRIIQQCMGSINPTRAEAVSHARRYSEWGQKLATC